MEKKSLSELLTSLLADDGYYSEANMVDEASSAKRTQLEGLRQQIISNETLDEQKVFDILKDVKLGDNAYFKTGDINLTDKMITSSEVSSIQIDSVGTYNNNSGATINNHYHSKSNNSGSSPKPYTEKYWQLPLRNPFFVGREPLLKDIKTHLEKESIGIVSQSLTGLGGVGKTHLALEFANKAYEQDDYDLVIWLSAQLIRENIEALAE